MREKELWKQPLRMGWAVITEGRKLSSTGLPGALHAGQYEVYATKKAATMNCNKAAGETVEQVAIFRLKS